MLTSSVTTGNVAGGLNGGNGGGIYNTGVLLLAGGEVTNNTAFFGKYPGNTSGGGIYDLLVAAAVRTTFTGNHPDNCAPPSSVPGCSN